MQVAIVNKAIGAHGGKAAVARLNIMSWGGEMKSTLPGVGEVTGTWMQAWRLPDRLKDVQELQIKGMKSSKIQVFNGNQAWVSWNGQTRVLRGKELAIMQQEMYAEIFDKIAPLMDKGYELSTVDEIKVEGRPAAGIKIAFKNRRDIILYFDKESGLLVKRENQTTDGTGKLVRAELYYSDYHEIDGLKLYSKSMAYLDGKKFAEFTITEFTTFDQLNDNVFAKP